MENARCVGMEIVRERVPLRRLIARFVRTGRRMSLAAPFGVRIFPRKDMLMMPLKKPAATAAGQG
jgi:hypothetical protein